MKLADYLQRIGLPAEGLEPFDELALRRVAAAHAATVPFENTRAHRGERISVDIDDILERLVTRREGGVCYELNGGLAWLLTELGADVEINAAQVLPDSSGVGGLPMSHLALIVTLPGAPRAFLVDVGFGGETILREVPDDGDIVTTGRASAYRIDRRPRQLSDFEGLAWWHSTSPGSRFMTGIIVSSTRPGGIVTVFGRDEGDSVSWFFRDLDADRPRALTRDEAQAIVADTFGLDAPLPQRVLRYAPVGG
ncbi:MAG TPA: arylamine N-acetyltransferase [Microbacteriaceae bacterium]|nr:arylamine N-acetyltransferase [Microbacteriaceae bacterium]